MTKVIIKSEKNSNVTDLIQSAIAAELKRVNLGLERTQVKVSEFEKKYNISSDTFFKEKRAEDLDGGDEEYVQWAGEYKLLKRIQQDHAHLKEIEYADQ